MAVTATPIFPQTITTYVVAIANADASTVKTLAAAGTNGTKIEAINVSLTDTTTRDLQIYATISATNYLLGTVNIPLSSGNTNAVPSIDLLRHSQLPFFAYDANGNKYIYLANGTTLSVASGSTVTSGKFLTVVAYGEDF